MEGAVGWRGAGGRALAVGRKMVTGEERNGKSNDWSQQ